MLSYTDKPYSGLEKDLSNSGTTKAVPEVHGNQTIYFTQKTSTVTPFTTTAANPIPKKPSLIDASHLKQDASSADGSNTASKLKQLTEERRIENVAGPPKLPENVNPIPGMLSPATDIVIPANTTNNVTNQSNITYMSIKFDQNKTTGVPLGSSESSIVPKNYTFPDIPRRLTTQSTFINPITTSTTMRVSETSSTSAAKQLPSNSATSPVMTTSTNPPTVHHANTTIGSVSSLVPVTARTSQHHRIVEHSVTGQFAKRFLFTQPLQPIQRVYYFLSALGLLTWLFTLTLTGWCQGLRCARSPTSTNEELQMRTRDRKFSIHGEATQPLVSCVDNVEHSYDNWLPASSK